MNVYLGSRPLKNLRPIEMPQTRWDKMKSWIELQKTDKENTSSRCHKLLRRKLRRDTFLVMEPSAECKSIWTRFVQQRKFRSRTLPPVNGVTEKRRSPSRSKRVNVGCVSGYGPIRRAPINVKPDGPSEKVVLPAINRSCNRHGDISEDERSCGWCVGVACQSQVFQHVHGWGGVKEI